MYRDELQDDEDLRVEIFHLKKQLTNVKTENYLLKVKIRKLQNEVIKKDKELDVVLDPRKSLDVRKILYERSASFVLNMKEKNDELLHLLHEKDIIIRRLQNQLEITKLYSQPTKKHFQSKSSDRTELDNRLRQIQMKLSCNKSETIASTGDSKKKKERSLSWTPGLQEAESTLIEEVELVDDNRKKEKGYDIKDQYRSLSRDHLLSIIENLKINQRYSPSSHQTSSRKSSPESDLERIELLCESPHEEIQQLHLHFLDMISEVDHLKNRIALLQNNQEKTENVLKKKNTNIDKLAQEIKNLKRPRAKSARNRNNKNYSSSTLAARIYSADNPNREFLTCHRQKNKINDKSGQKNKKSDRSTDSERASKQKTKDVMTQVEKMEQGVTAPHCIYVEKESIIVTQKVKEKNENDYEYDDEVFEECDEESVAVN